MTRVVVVLAALLSLVLGAAVAQAANLEQIGSFEQPIYVTSDPGNPDRLFVVERAGRIELVEGDTKSVFADLRADVSCCGGEQGLLSIALAPDFDSSGRLFVDYIGKETEPQIHVAELVAGGSTAPLSSLRQILEIPHPNQSNHYGGQLQFGPEGDLFVSTGDGGGGNDSEHNAQDVARPLGKILRLDPDPDGALPYTVPADNPFVTGAGWAPLVWSYGLRNPFRFSFDRDGSAILIGDVGQGAREEVDRAPLPNLGRGWNYGWNCREGTVAGPETDPGCTERAGTFAEPIFDYPHDVPPEGGSARCAIIGGYVVHDPGLGSLDGRYIYGDNCSAGLRSIEATATDIYGSDRGEGIAVSGLTSFGEDSCGRIYATSGGGPVYRLVGATPTDCAAGPPPGGGGSSGGGSAIGPAGSATGTAPATGQPVGRAASSVRIRARSRAVRRGGHAYLNVSVSPCGGRAGETVTLRRAGRAIERRALGGSCTARFRPTVGRPSSFRATIPADATYVGATSPPLRIELLKPRPGR